MSCCNLILVVKYFRVGVWHMMPFCFDLILLVAYFKRRLEHVGDVLFQLMYAKLITQSMVMSIQWDTTLPMAYIQSGQHLLKEFHLHENKKKIICKSPKGL